LTDHDTVEGIPAAAAALPPGLTLISGMELSCRRDGHGVHLLGYLFNPAHEELAAEIRAIRASRLDRAKDMVARLNELGVPVTWEQVMRIAGEGVVGRPHIALAMIEVGAVKSVDEAFTDEWIGPGGRAHVRRYALDPADAIALLHDAGGVAVLAHPYAVTRGWTVPDDLIADLALAGLDGVEVAHPDHDEEGREHLLTVTRGLGLAATGGSDDHGELTGDRIGSEATGQDDLDALLARASGAAVITG
ncbi:MAG: PHP domain-containing protein, partial [Nocardiopsaceae bacterium]|nr:PHP domain-containing protein [Nocardiopsaceae bacterium]